LPATRLSHSNVQPEERDERIHAAELTPTPARHQHPPQRTHCSRIRVQSLLEGREFLYRLTKLLGDGQ
jgi:hypothetical protein